MGQGMARITIEDCMDHVPNRFHLVRMASIRAKQLKKGALPLLGSEDNKVVVMSLREIAAGLVKPGEADPSASFAESDAAPTAAETAPAVEASETEQVEPTIEADEPTPTVES
jgi:DNA-directed RNA polymerase subunit omega